MDDDSLVYDSAPLESALEILGRPVAKLTVVGERAARQLGTCASPMCRRTGR